MKFWGPPTLYNQQTRLSVDLSSYYHNKHSGSHYYPSIVVVFTMAIHLTMSGVGITIQLDKLIPASDWLFTSETW